MFLNNWKLTWTNWWMSRRAPDTWKLLETERSVRTSLSAKVRRWNGVWLLIVTERIDRWRCHRESITVKYISNRLILMDDILYHRLTQYLWGVFKLVTLSVTNLSNQLCTVLFSTAKTIRLLIMVRVLNSRYFIPISIINLNR